MTAIAALNVETCTGLLIGHFDFNKGGDGERAWVEVEFLPDR